MQPSQWRTILFLMYLVAAFLLGLLICSNMTAETLGKEGIGTLAWVIIALAFAATGKSLGEKAVAGDGLRTGLARLWTDAKPPAPGVPEAPPTENPGGPPVVPVTP